jgi:hypothetical protein
VSRYDLAKEYINETTRLVAPPAEKNRIKIPRLSTPEKKATKTQPGTPSQNYVVLPQGEDTQHVLALKDAQYNQLMGYFNSVKESERQAWETVASVKTKDDGVIRDKDAELDRLRAQPNIFVRAWHFITGLFKWGILGFVVLLIGALVVSIWIPELLPLIFTVLKTIGVVISGILGLIARGISALINLFRKK